MEYQFYGADFHWRIYESGHWMCIDVVMVKTMFSKVKEKVFTSKLMDQYYAFITESNSFIQIQVGG